MNADQVRAYVNAKRLGAMQSPLAQLFARAAAGDAAAQTIGFAGLQAVSTDAQIRRDAVAHAASCLDACDGWEVESLGFNIECNFTELDSNKCDEIAQSAIRKRGLI